LAFKTQTKNVLDFNATDWELVPDTMIYMSLLEGSRLEYWGMKGISSVPLVSSLTRELAVADEQLAFKDQLLENCKKYQEEYRSRLETLSGLYSKKQEDYVRLEIQAEEWERKAKTRNKILWGVGGAAAVLLFGIAIGV
jgi:hypothetical protein